MANAQPEAEEEQQGSSWMRTIMNAVKVYFAINVVPKCREHAKFGHTKQSGRIRF
jgi:hypothetical protein